MIFQRLLFLFLLISGILLTYCQSGEHDYEFYAASWNVENLFDILDDSLKNDDEFLPESSKEWDGMKFERKIINLGKVIKYINNGKAPDVIGFEEVENIMVCKYIAYEFKDRDYILCHRNSPDKRGIDNALMYDRKVFDIVKVEAIEVQLPSGYPTRDILHVILKVKSSDDTLHFFVNHWPSRRGGQHESEPNRIAAAKVLKESIAKLRLTSPEAEFIIMGDFNDEPADTSIRFVLDAGTGEISENNLLNTAYPEYGKGNGTYLYRGDWNMLDQIIISGSLKDDKAFRYINNSFEIIKPDFMITKDGDYKGAAIPTFAGKKYLGGYSDHYPVGIKFVLQKSDE